MFEKNLQFGLRKKKNQKYDIPTQRAFFSLFFLLLLLSFLFHTKMEAIRKRYWDKEECETQLQVSVEEAKAVVACVYQFISPCGQKYLSQVDKELLNDDLRAIIRSQPFFLPFLPPSPLIMGSPAVPFQEKKKDFLGCLLLPFLESSLYLERFLLPLFEAESKKPYAPLLRSILLILNFKISLKLKYSRYLKKVITVGHKRQMMGEVLIGHMKAFLKNSKLDFEAMIEATFVANLAGAIEKSYLYSFAYPPFFGEPILVPLLQKKKNAKGELQIKGESSLLELLSMYRIPQEVVFGSEESYFFVNFILEPLKRMRETMKISDDQMSDDMRGGLQITSDFITSVICLLTDVTGQPLCGRFVAWLVSFWVEPSSTIPSPSPPLFFFLHVAREFTQFLTKLNFPVRKLTTALLQLQVNLLSYLQTTNKQFLPSLKPSISTYSILADRIEQPDFSTDCASQLRKFYGMQSLYPSVEFLRDILEGDFYLPKTHIQFLSFPDFICRNFILYKVSAAHQIATDLTTASPPSLLPLISLTPSYSYSADLLLNIPPNIPPYQAVSRMEESSFLLLLRVDPQTGELLDIVGGSRKKGKQNHAQFNGKLSLTINVEQEPMDYIYSLTKKEKSTSYFNFVFFLNPQMESYVSILTVIGRLLSGKSTPEWLQRVLIGTASPPQIRTLCGLGKEMVDKTDFPILLRNAIQGVTDLLPALKRLEMKGYGLETDENFDIKCLLNLREAGNDKDSSSRMFKIPLDFQGPPPRVPLYPAQKDASLSSLLNRITLIVGPPGTGKTTVTLQILLLLHRNFCKKAPQNNKKKQKILMVTHSNLALDSIIGGLLAAEKADIASVSSPSLPPPPPIHTLRFGSRTTSPAAQAATVDGHVQKKKNEIIDVCKHYGYSPTSHKPTICRNLFSDLANPLTNGTRDGRREGEEGLKVIQNYFNSLFNPLLGLFGERDRGAGAGKVRFADRRMHEKYYEVGKKCGIPEEIFMVADRFKRFQGRLGRIQDLLSFLSLPFYEKRNILLQECDILFATCSGLASQRASWMDDNGVKFDICMVEEAGKLNETESLLLINEGLSRLILIGDDKQLSGILKHKPLSSEANYSQSLFGRLRRLGVKPVILNQQGRAISQLADLYRWRYNNMTDLPSTSTFRKIKGLYSPLQFITTGKTTAPTNNNNPPETNQQEAEWVITLIDYLLTLNPSSPSPSASSLSPSDISVITPYRNQKALVERLLKERVLGRVGSEKEVGVFTTDEYQGKENEVVIVSLVLSGSSPSPHLRDERRLCVLTSRAKRALLLVGKFSTFYNCPEWKPIFRVINPDQAQESKQLQLPQPQGPYLHLLSPVGDERKLQVISNLQAFETLLQKEKKIAQEEDGINHLGEALKEVKLKE